MGSKISAMGIIDLKIRSVRLSNANVNELCCDTDSDTHMTAHGHCIVILHMKCVSAPTIELQCDFCNKRHPGTVMWLGTQTEHIYSDN